MRQRKPKLVLGILKRSQSVSARRRSQSVRFGGSQKIEFIADAEDKDNDTGHVLEMRGTKKGLETADGIEEERIVRLVEEEEADCTNDVEGVESERQVKHDNNTMKDGCESRMKKPDEISRKHIVEKDGQSDEGDGTMAKGSEKIIVVEGKTNANDFQVQIRKPGCFFKLVPF